MGKHRADNEHFRPDVCDASINCIYSYDVVSWHCLGVLKLSRSDIAKTG